MGYVVHTEDSEPVEDFAIAYSEAAMQCRTAYDILRLLKKLTLDLGYRYFAVYRLPGDLGDDFADITLVSNWPPELVRAYDEHRLLPASPMIKALRETTRPVTWNVADLNSNRADGADELVISLFREFGLLSGTCFPVHDARGRRGAVSFTGERKPCSLNEQVQLAWLCNLIFQQADATRSEAERSLPKLTERETQCLVWTAAGKTSPEIAVILELSEHTVNHYLASSCQKLSAVNRAHAVAKALRLGYID
ncbi:MAG: LuxR family transcriptional regulator [Phyllobacteriaceae bacterium]|nr:LuxR family transcriptional regulator [Phyllobacteriaceae bacterium]MBA92284.1 LuxR family transcriptional regulator [Phyllobacteriaceae bacterium]